LEIGIGFDFGGVCFEEEEDNNKATIMQVMKNNTIHLFMLLNLDLEL
jgi:hypothetical protein